MDCKDLKLFALRKTIAVLEKEGLKYSRAEFGVDSMRRNTLGFLVYQPRVIERIDDGIEYRCYYDDIDRPERGKRLKKMSLNFLTYVQCVVEKEYISFVYFYKQLEIEYLTINDTDASAKQNEKERVIEKIKKLLALAQSDNESEAISAALMAQKLLAKNHLSMNDVDATHSEEEPIEDCYCVTEEGKDKFKYDLASIVANNFCCKTYFTAHYIHFRGYRIDIMAARNCYGFLYNSARKLGHARERTVRKLGQSATGVYDSFVDGFLSAIQAELNKQCTALMLVTPERVLEEWNDFKESSNMREKDLSRNLGTDYDSWIAGNKEGKKIFDSQYLDDTQHYIGRKEM